eukprot:scaffold101720_cov20-Tisochrysis_lutea.AAC.1
MSVTNEAIATVAIFSGVDSVDCPAADALLCLLETLDAVPVAGVEYEHCSDCCADGALPRLDCNEMMSATKLVQRLHLCSVAPGSQKDDERVIDDLPRLDRNEMMSAANLGPVSTKRADALEYQLREAEAHAGSAATQAQEQRQQLQGLIQDLEQQHEAQLAQTHARDVQMTLTPGGWKQGKLMRLVPEKTEATSCLVAGNAPDDFCVRWLESSRCLMQVCGPWVRMWTWS